VTTQESLVTLTVDRHVALVTLNRPGARNALSTPMITELRRVLKVVDEDEGVSAVVLTGADPAFCAGVDLSELSAPNYGQGHDMSSFAVRQSDPWLDLTKPIIGAINGFAVTGGLEVALHCDLLIASEKARFADLHAKFGMLPTWGMSVLLPNAGGGAFARRMSLSGQFVDAETALRIGLVTQVTEHGKLIPTALAVARDIGESSQPAVRATLANYRRLQHQPLTTGREIEAESAREFRESDFDPEEIKRRRETLRRGERG
jgi:enoyl-CoA hydratase